MSWSQHTVPQGSQQSSIHECGSDVGIGAFKSTAYYFGLHTGLSQYIGSPPGIFTPSSRACQFLLLMQAQHVHTLRVLTTTSPSCTSPDAPLTRCPSDLSPPPPLLCPPSLGPYVLTTFCVMPSRFTWAAAPADVFHNASLPTSACMHCCI